MEDPHEVGPHSSTQLRLDTDALLEDGFRKMVDVMVTELLGEVFLNVKELQLSLEE